MCVKFVCICCKIYRTHLENVVLIGSDVALAYNKRCIYRVIYIYKAFKAKISYPNYLVN